MKYYVVAKDKLFNNSEITRISRELVEYIIKIKPQTLDSDYFELFKSVKVSGYFFCSIRKDFGIFKKRRLSLQEFAKERGLTILASNMKKLEDIVTHRELLKRYTN